VTPHASPAEVRAWVAAHLDPLEVDASEAPAFRSDFDLNADWKDDPPARLTPAAVLIGLVERPEGLSVILTRRADTLRQHTGQVALPGGRVDGDETPWACALREAHEEIGLDPALVGLAGLSTTYRTGTGYSITPVVGFVEAGCVLTPNPGEVADIFETPFGFLMDPLNHEERQHQIPGGALRRFYAMTWRDRMIWGATAGILRALYDRLYGAAIG
jgi:8-oxo-dGTP pyrophosphatase MutT (NUDIX family)